ncbi:hypothetical protein BDA99DRAFT_429418 [Phascolomyces articulosus]|uniref:Uncharacterized protein n=1 Tax=Phascolomyces articulosus TaxID=60185 RepID=A0AAD5KT29_9FUNG|nr:hypothetical protein BDA99DRAFT_429418 [Phascolomyces articulosus]
MTSQSNPQQKHLQSSQYRVVIAYDFGTTYSGAAYAFTHSSPTEIFDVQNWPHKGANFYPKVPTLSVYPCNNQQQRKSSGRASLSEWGHSAKKAMLVPGAAKENVLLSQFKLHLDESLQRSELANGLTPVKAVADYLSELHKHTLQELSRSFAKNYHPDTFRYCLTVPAVWTDKAKNQMRQAAIQAGLINPSDPSDRLILVSEPEAAALYCEETMADQVQLKDNDRIMICDAGGGTVDLIVFQVNFKNGGSSGGRKRELKEVTKGMGESCGSVFLDERYRELLKKKFGKYATSKINDREMNTMMEQFINDIKPEFNEVENFYVELPRSVKVKDLPSSVRQSDSDGHLEDGVLQLSGQELKKQVFDPVVDKVISLIEQQYKQIPDGRLNFLFLVGGFGSSKYLYQRVHEVFQGTKVHKILCPIERSALAVVRGAAYYGLNPQTVVSRISRRTYGTCVYEYFDDKIDPRSKRVVKPNRIICKDRFLPYIKKNDEVPVDYCVKKNLFAYYKKNGNVSVDIYATENDTVPRYCDEPGVHLIAKMTIAIPKMVGVKKDEPVDMFERMYFGTTEIRLEAEFCTGKTHDVKCNLDVSFQ